MIEDLFMDYETFWSQEYTLRKMTPIEYVYDPRFEVLGCGFKRRGEKSIYVEAPEMPAYMESIDWSKTNAISHNTLFDALVTAVHYKKVAAHYGDTISMARNWIVHSTGRVSLDACVKFYGESPKMNTVTKTCGLTWADIIQLPELRRELQVYGADDTDKCAFLYDQFLREGFPVKELDIIDMVVKMAVDPKFELDINVVAEHYSQVLAEKQALLDRVGLDNRDNLMSDAPFAAMLLFAGLTEVPEKISVKTGKKSFAFAKTDKAFQALLEHENPDIQALVAARLGVKSTMEQTRSERFLRIGAVAPMFPVPLKYSGAHTHRFSGDWSLNLQNLKRGGKLRKGMKAPKGKVVISVDASQIEARLNACLSGEDELVEAFRRGEDVYASFAGQIYHKTINKRDHPNERFVGKTGILSLGYSSSAIVFQNMVRNQSRDQSQGKNIIDMPLIDAQAIVDLYRATYPNIKLNWDHAGRIVMPQLAGLMGLHDGGMWGPLEIHKFAIRLPNGNWLRYRDLCQIWDEETNRQKWMFYRGQIPTYLYGAKLVENVIQALAFVHIMEVAHRVYVMTNGLLRPAHQVHDELIYVEDEKLAPQIEELVRTEMSRPPVWMPDAPLAAEGGWGPTYGDTK